MIEKILERLEEVKTKRFVSGFTNNLYELGACHAMDIAKEVVKEVAKEYEEKKYYRITLTCLEDSTNLEMPLTKQEYLFLERLSELVYRVATGCMPTMYVEQKGE